ncbi:LysE/ArgO family amino acid transporter [Micrococcus terreus]|uniref:LysE/ArgO family amino acid transporter n=1 Tax=Micrococcus terreus TaxID=574650 RepID=UPI003D70C7D6
MWTTWTAGLLTGLALIVAIGAQNAFVLRQGIRREHVGVVVLVCLLSDALLILAGTAGIGVIVEKVPVVLEILRWGGAAYLIWFAVQSVRSAFSPTSLTPEKPRCKGSVLTTTLALTYLNPHVYLDTVVLLGSLANQQGPDLRWVFAGGAVVGSIVWFSALGYGARALVPVLDRPRAWQIVDLVIAAVMLALAVSLILR